MRRQSIQRNFETICYRPSIRWGASRRVVLVRSPSLSVDGPELESALRMQHLTREVESIALVSGGEKFTIRAILIGPNGQSAGVVSVWFIRTGEARPRFVTAYPGGLQ